MKGGFTLVELLIVMTIIVVVAGLALSSIGSTTSLQVFNNNFEKIVSLLNNARSMAITGKGQLDYTDFDNDGCTDSSIIPGSTCSYPDYVTPANYGVHFDTASANQSVSLFADINPPASGATGAKGRFDTSGTYASGKDAVLGDILTLPSNFTLEVSDGGTGVISTNPNIFYSPDYADISLENVTATPFLYIKLQYPQYSYCRLISIHKLAGVPEVKACP